MTYAAETDDGKPVAAAASLTELVAAVAAAGRPRVATVEPTTNRRTAPRGSRAEATADRAAPQPVPTPVTEWTPTTIGTLAESVVDTIAGQRVTSHPSLRAVPGGVVLDMASSPTQARAQTRQGIITLLGLSIPQLKPSAVAQLPVGDRIALSQSPYASTDALLRDCTGAAIRGALGPTDDVTDSARYAAVRAQVARDVPQSARRVLAAVGDAMTRIAPIRTDLDRVGPGVVSDDVTEQLDHLVYEGFIADTGFDHLLRLPAYLDAIVVRLAKLPAAAAQDARAMSAVDTVTARWNSAVARATPARRAAINEQIHWMVEELRIGLFAERIGTAYPVSEKRILRAIDALGG